MTYPRGHTFYRAEEVQAVRLDMIGEAYFTPGDNHRLSVARCLDEKLEEGQCG